ncbi:penicillin-binding protein activator [bacterium]|nr:penicillin-binding protein activator [bacterium]
MKKITLLLLFIASFNAFGQTKKQPLYQTYLDEGLKAYKQHNFTKAREDFSAVLQREPNELTSSAEFLLSLTYYQLTNFSKAKIQCENFRKNYPESLYFEESTVLLAKIFYQLGNFEQAVLTFFEELSKGKNTELKHETEKLVSEILAVNFTKEEIENFGKKLTNTQAELLQRLAKQSGKDKITQIAVILPLTGTDREIGNKILDGIKFAFNEFIKMDSLKIALRIEDTESDFVNVVKITKKLATSGEVVCAIGPITSEEFIAASGIASEYNFPIISPTATKTGITELGKTIFQANTDFKSCGKFVANHILSNYQNPTIAILAPLDNYGIKIIEGFTETLNNANCKTIAEEWYNPGIQDFSQQIRRIKNASFEPIIQDSINAEFEKIIAQDEQEFDLELLKTQLSEKWHRDFVGIGKKIDAFFVPCYSDELSYILPQTTIAGLDATFFGNENWYDEKLLNDNKIYAEGSFFTSDYFWENTEPEVKNFITNYRTLMKKNPGKMNVYGYDTAKLVFETLSLSGSERENFARELSKVKNFQGMQREISFENNSNQSLHLLNLQNGQILKVKKQE